jgi:cytochrome c oxidase cbb3-type subunit 2
VYTAAPLPTPLWYEYTWRAYPNAATPPYVAPVAAAYVPIPYPLCSQDLAGVPYTDAEIQGAAEAVKGKTELEALIAYLQVLGTAVK